MHKGVYKRVQLCTRACTECTRCIQGYNCVQGRVQNAQGVYKGTTVYKGVYRMHKVYTRVQLCTRACTECTRCIQGYNCVQGRVQNAQGVYKGTTVYKGVYRMHKGVYKGTTVYKGVYRMHKVYTRVQLCTRACTECTRCIQGYNCVQGCVQNFDTNQNHIGKDGRYWIGSAIRKHLVDTCIFLAKTVDYVWSTSIVSSIRLDIHFLYILSNKNGSSAELDQDAQNQVT
ncbi:hypothetical protein CEXT_384901 [Caerostris extrusa]|uniref:Uncharacterized protein n=1 Tax=Caerostris extrusa TaxID=172846 RepID=A0AAV4QSU7_CAEEX|nr:hypothetical protein CEXT_384901 [Caerostris extrusa]